MAETGKAPFWAARGPAALAAALLLGGCAVKGVVSNEHHVVVESLTTGSAMNFAKAECAHYGRTPVLTGTGLGTFVFDCRNLDGVPDSAPGKAETAHVEMMAPAEAQPAPPPPAAAWTPPQPAAQPAQPAPPPLQPHAQAQMAQPPQPAPQPMQQPAPQPMAPPPHPAAASPAPAPQHAATQPPPADVAMEQTAAPAAEHPPPAPRRPQLLTARADVDGWWVQVAADRTRDEAASSGRRVKSRFARLLRDRTYRIVRIDKRDGVTYYRSRFGPYASKAAAGRACSTMRSRSQACIIAR